MKPLRRLGMGPNVVVVAGDQKSYYLWEVLLVSIVRIGLAETKHFSEGYAAIFGGKKKKDNQEKPAKQEAKAKKAGKKTGKAGKKKGKK
jgi:hypothetical protein